MTEPHDHQPTDPHPLDFYSKDEDAWLRERYPAASADFVADTLARVMADRTEIDAEATKVEEIQFDAAFLAELQTPEASGGFVERVFAAVKSQREHTQSKDRALEHLLSQYTVPTASADFVRRTLTALGTRRRPHRRVHSRQWALGWAAAAALLLLLPFVLGPWQPAPAITQGPPTAAYTPVRFGAVMATTAKLRGWRSGDDLVTLAYLGSRPGEDSGPNSRREGK